MTPTATYVGSIGSMVALPDVYSPTEVPLRRLGGSSQSAGGRQWRDTLGYARSWTLRWSNLLPGHIAYVEALSEGLVDGPLRLIDPRRTNRLPVQVASGGSRARSTAGFAVTAGGLIYRPLRATATDRSTLAPAALLRGCQEWVRSAGGSGTCYLSGDSADGTWRLPLIPGGDDLELSCWVAGTAGVPVELQWTEYDAADGAKPYYSNGDSDNATLSATVWQRLTLVTRPSARPTSVSLTPRLTTPAGSPAGSVLHTAWQIAAVGAEDIDLPLGGDDACLPPELSGGWRTGGGAPFVVVDPDTAVYGRPAFRDLAVVLVET